MSIRSYGGEVQKLVPDVVATPDPEPYEEADAKELTASIRMVPSKRGEKVHVPLCESSKTDLHRAVDNSDPELLEQLLATKTIDINAQSWDLSTALLISVRASKGGAELGTREPLRIACCKLLIEAGANLDVKGQWGQTALAVASMSGYPAVECCEMLVNAGADIMMLDDFGCTAVHCAAMGGHELQLKELLKHPDAQKAVVHVDNEGMTALGRAEQLLKRDAHTHLVPSYCRVKQMCVPGWKPAPASDSEYNSE